MGIRDDELKRLIHYTKGLGTVVEMKQKGNNRNKAEWFADGKKIVVYTQSTDTKVSLILVLIHELGHMLDFVAKGRVSDSNELQDALSKMNDGGDTDIKSRYLVYLTEIDGMKYWDKVITDCNIKIPSWRINLEKEFDTWLYERYWKTNEFPTLKDRRNKRKELKEKYGRK